MLSLVSWSRAEGGRIIFPPCSKSFRSLPGNIETEKHRYWVLNGLGASGKKFIPNIVLNYMDLAALFFSFKNSFVMFTKNDDNDSSFYRVTRKNCYFYFTCNSRNMSKLKNTPPNKKLKKAWRIYVRLLCWNVSEFFIKRCEFYRFEFIGKSE